jgi:ATP-dependent helicase/nuclease subunit B
MSTNTMRSNGDSGVELHIRYVPGAVRPIWGKDVLNLVEGGPDCLLAWLETQLGLPVRDAQRTARIAAYASVLDRALADSFKASFEADRWSTATVLLDRRDALLLSGWDGKASGSNPLWVNEMAAVESGSEFPFPGEAERLRRVLDALDAGQQLPPHQCRLVDPVETWPVAWLRVLSRLTVTQEEAPQASATESSSLFVMQGGVLGDGRGEVEADPTFRQVRTLSATAAVEFVAATLARTRGNAERTAVVCEDDDLALRLDAALHRIGVPTMGVSGRTTAHPVLQVLPLYLAMGWGPVDPEVALAFLTLPVLPIPLRAAGRLARALAEEPGVGGAKWAQAMDELCKAAAQSNKDKPDAGEVLRDQLRTWLEGERTPRDGKISTALVRERCGLVARWASGRAAYLEKQEQAEPALVYALRTAAGQAALLGELAQCQGSALSEPQLNRLLEDVLAPGLESQSHPELEGSPIRVRSLSEVGGGVDRLIWLGPVASETVGSRWSASQCRELEAAGLAVDDGSQALSALRSAEARGFCHVRGSMLVVIPPLGERQRLHPVWISASSRLERCQRESPPVLEQLVATGSISGLEPFNVACAQFSAEPPQPARSLWQIPKELMAERERVSATELEERLACPLKWVLKHQAGLYRAFTAQLPDARRLKGSFAHRILELVLGDGGSLPTPDDAVERLRSVFDERLALDAAPLAQPKRRLDAELLRSELERSTRVLVETLARGGYRIHGFEVEVDGTALGRPLSGQIDCLAQREDGAEAVIDFKYGGRSKYGDALREGTATQLATYAHARQQARGSSPAVAYLVLSDSMLLTPRDSAVAGAASTAVVAGPAIEQVWTRFARALQTGGDWLEGKVPVPARPLQDPGAWPVDADLVLKRDLKDGEWQSVCRYCDYTRLCGMEETR